MQALYTNASAHRLRLAATAARFTAIAGALLILTPGAARAAPAAGGNPLKDAYFGEQHIHTAYSLDAYIGGARLTPSDAYRFAKGEEVEVNGVKLRISAPLDWAAVTDHAEYIGEMYSTMNPGAPGYDQAQVQQLRDLDTLEEREQWFLEYVVKSNRGTTPAHPPFYAGPETAAGGWKQILAAAEEHNAPGRFTTIPAFEWSAAPGGANLHRNVFFRDTKVPERPISYIDINREDGLWRWLAGLEEQGMQVIAIPTTPMPARARCSRRTTRRVPPSTRNMPRCAATSSP